MTNFNDKRMKEVNMENKLKTDNSISKNLTNEENKELLDAIFFATNDEKSEIYLTKFLLGNLGLVHQLSESLSELSGVKIEELESYGYEGLMNIAKKYSPEDSSSTLNNYLISYIKGYMLGGIAEIKGYHKGKFYTNVSKIKRELLDGLSEEEYDVSPQELTEKLVQRGCIHSRNRKDIEYRLLLHDTTSVEVHQQEVDDIEDCNMDFDVQLALKDVLREVIEECLTPREQTVLSMRFGLDGSRSLNLLEVSKKLHLTWERARQIEAKALRKLKVFSKDYELDSFVNEINKKF